MNKLNPIDVKALRELRGNPEQVMWLLEYEPDKFLINNPEIDNFLSVVGNTVKKGLSDYEAVAIAISWLESEIMGIEGYVKHCVGINDKGKWCVKVWRESLEWIPTIVGADFMENKTKREMFTKKTKLTALIEAHKEL